MDGAFLQKLRERDPSALAEVVRQHTGPLYRASLGLGFSKPEAEDLVQSVWAVFLDTLSRFEGRSSVKTFLFGILYNKASELRRARGRADLEPDIEKIFESHFDEKEHWIKAHSPLSPDRFFESVEISSLVAKCLELLPFKQKMAFFLKEVEEEVTSEICRTLEITAQNLGVLLFRARNQLRECIEQKSR